MRSHGLTICLAICLAATMFLMPDAQLLFVRRTVDIMVAYQVIREWMDRFHK